MRSKVTVAVFVMSAAFAFVFSLPGVAASATRAVSAAGCKKFESGGSYLGEVCSLPIGSDMPSSAITGAYFDYNQYLDGNVQASLKKRTYTGSVYTDYTSTMTAGLKDVHIQAINVKQSPSMYDYMEGTVIGPGLNTQGAVIGIFLTSSN